MRLNSRQEFACGADLLFYKMTDFERFRTLARRNGFDSVRTDGEGPIHPGSGWIVRGRWRGRERVAEITLTGVKQDEALDFETEVEGFDVLTHMEIRPIDQNRCVLSLKVDMRARSLKARMLAPTLRMAQRRINKRLSRAIRRQAFKIAQAAN